MVPVVDVVVLVLVEVVPVVDVVVLVFVEVVPVVDVVAEVDIIKSVRLNESSAAIARYSPSELMELHPEM